MRATPRVILILKQASSAVRLHKTRAQKLAMTVINRKLAKIRVFKGGFFHFLCFLSLLVFYVIGMKRAKNGHGLWYRFYSLRMLLCLPSMLQKSMCNDFEF